MVAQHASTGLDTNPVIDLSALTTTKRHTWAARYNTWLLNKLSPKGVVFSFLPNDGVSRSYSAHLMMLCMLKGLLASSVWKPSIHDRKDDGVLMPRMLSVNQMEDFELGREGTNGGRKGRSHAIGRSLQACNALPNALLSQATGS